MPLGESSLLRLERAGFGCNVESRAAQGRARRHVPDENESGTLQARK